MSFNGAVGVQELVDPEKGYMKDDAVTLEVYVKADAPHGVRYTLNFFINLMGAISFNFLSRYFRCSDKSTQQFQQVYIMSPNKTNFERFIMYDDSNKEMENSVT